MKYAFGVDIGGTTVKIGCFLADGTLQKKWEIPTRKQDGGSQILPDIITAIEDYMDQIGICDKDLAGIGLGVPGAVLNFETVNECVNLGWGRVEVTKAIKQAFACNVKVTNDANVAALGELWGGAAKGYDSSVMVTLGTGVGSGIIVEGQVINGSHGYGGELGHTTVNFDDERICNCGKKGCLELYASATGIVYETKKALKGEARDTKLNQIDDLTAKDIFDCAKEGDEVAMEQVDRLGMYLARAMGNLALSVDPEIFVIGGGVSRAGDVILDAIHKYYDTYTYGSVQGGKFAIATLGNDAGIYGAAKLVI